MKSLLFNDALNNPSGCDAVCFSVEVDDSESSCRVGRGWMDMEGGASLEDCVRRLIPACDNDTCLCKTPSDSYIM